MQSAQILPTPFMAHRYCEHELLFQQFNETNKELVVIGRDLLYRDCFKCVAKDDVANLRSVDAQIQSECRSIENWMVYDPLVGELCMAKTQELGWIRGSCLSKNEAFVNVVMNVARANIRVSCCIILIEKQP